METALAAWSEVKTNTPVISNALARPETNLLRINLKSEVVRLVISATSLSKGTSLTRQSMEPQEVILFKPTRNAFNLWEHNFINHATPIGKAQI